MSAHETQTQGAQGRSHEGNGHGEQHPPWWVEGPHNVQRATENVYAPYEMWHHLQHAATGAHSVHGAATGAGALGHTAPVAPALTATRHAAPMAPELVAASHAAPATSSAPTASQAAQVLKEPTTPEMAEMVENIRRAQAADQAALQASRAVPAAAQATTASAATATEAATVTEAATGSRVASTLGQAAKGVSTFGRVMGGLGVLGGGLELYEGVQDIRHGHMQQGALDVAAGTAGVGAGALALAGVACPPAALAAAGLGALAYGNKYTKDHRWWGQNAQHENRSAFDWAGAQTASAYQGTRHALGGGLMGTLGGGLAAGATALGTGTVAAVGDVLGGVVGAARGVGHFANRLMHH